MTTVESPQAPTTVDNSQSPAQPLATSAPPSPTASPLASPTPSVQTSSNTTAQVANHFELMAERDGDNLAEAQALTSPESPAWYYALALAARADAYVDSGSSEEPASYGEDDQGNPQICDPDAELGEEPDRDACVTYTAIQATPDGKLVTFKVNDKPLSERISTTKGSSVTTRGAKFPVSPVTGAPATRLPSRSGSLLGTKVSTAQVLVQRFIAIARAANGRSTKPSVHTRSHLTPTRPWPCSWTRGVWVAL